MYLYTMWIDLHGVRRKLYVYYVLFLELDNFSVFFLFVTIVTVLHYFYFCIAQNVLQIYFPIL